MTAAPIDAVESWDGENRPSIDQESLPWTEEKWLALGETKPRIELFDGSLLVNAAPTPQHQEISFWLATVLQPAVRAADLRVYEAINLRLKPGRIPIPDLVITTRIDSKQLIVDADACRLVCEIISPSNPATDRVLKMHYYAEAGIAWYLLVDPEPELTLRLYRLNGTRYAEHAVGRPGEPLKLTHPVHVVIDPSTLDD
jgi:Uma2 family endonuclease